MYLEITVQLTAVTLTVNVTCMTAEHIGLEAPSESGQRR